MGRIATMATTLALVVTVVACDGTHQVEDGASSTSTAEPATATTSSRSTPKTHATENDAESEAPTVDQAAAPELTGFGATRQAWNANHEQAPGSTEGLAYLPMVEPDQPKYAAVCCDDRILLYTLVLASGTSLDEAQAQVAAELPADAEPGRLIDLGGCKTQRWKSATVKDAIGANALATYFVNVVNSPGPVQYKVAMSKAGSVTHPDC